MRTLESTLYDILIAGDLMETNAETSVAFDPLNKWENMYRRNSSWDQKWQAEVEMNQVEAPKLSIFNKSQKPPGKINNYCGPNFANVTTANGPEKQRYAPNPIDQEVIIRQNDLTQNRHNIPHFGASLLDYGAPRNRSEMK